MSCCQQCTSNGLAGWADALIAGSFIRVGFRLNTAYGTPEDQDSGALMARVMSCLYADGKLDYVDAEFSSGWFTDYITVTGRTLIDFAQAEDVGGYIQQVIQRCLPYVTISGRDPVVVDSIPADQAQTPGVQQPTWQQYQPPGTGQYRGSAPSGCSFEKMSLTDYLACQLGMTPTNAAVVGAAGALLVALVVMKAVR